MHKYQKICATHYQQVRKRIYNREDTTKSGYVVNKKAIQVESMRRSHFYLMDCLFLFSRNDWLFITKKVHFLHGRLTKM